MNLNENRITKYTLVCYESINNSCPKQLYSVDNSLITYIMMCIIIVVTVCGNLLVVISISHFRQLHTPTNYLILSLAMVDLLLGGFVMPPLMARIAESCWYFGDFFCKFHLSSAIMLCTASIIHLCLISVDRYFAVCYPLRYRNIVTALVTFIFIFISWVLSAVLGFVILFLELNIKGIEEQYINTKCVGSCYLMQNEASGLASSLFSFYIPGFVMICIYLKIFAVARRQARAIRDTGHLNQTAEEKKQAATSRRETKAAKTLAIVLGVFLVCWFPFFLCNIIDPLLNHVMSPLFIELLTWFGYMNSTFNPLVYGFFYSWFRKALKLIASGKIFHNNSSRTKLLSD
ncbi:trace amine-associated receptor 1-like [Polypterus senegalus]|uniref:trace amine-associated receptor 1-like n=1 Tax=Polypterus senegalus TaxID=55291 RepID=UPI0019653694|nr:trace amine-associated receptor 1-like [Polypterus senegalus]